MSINYPLESGMEVLMFLLLIFHQVFSWILSNIGTLGMFVLTLFYVIYTKKMLEASKEALKQGEINLKESRKPEVILYFDAARINILDFYVKNVGSTLAMNIKIDIEIIRGHLNKEEFLECSMIKEGITVLAPNQELKTFVDTFMNIGDAERNFPSILTKLKYEDSKGEVYQESYIHDLNMYKGRLQIVDKTIHDLVKEIEKINKNIGKLSK